MANTYTLIASYAATGNVSTIDFSSIPQTYTDLVLRFSGRVSNSINVVDDTYLQINGSSASFSMRRVFGDGANAYGDTGGGTFSYVSQTPNASATGSVFGNVEVYIPSYTSSNNKSLIATGVGENAASNSYILQSAVYHANAAAINQLTLVNAASNFVQYSTAYLYGIKNS